MTIARGSREVRPNNFLKVEITTDKQMGIVFKTGEQFTKRSNATVQWMRWTTLNTTN